MERKSWRDWVLALFASLIVVGFTLGMGDRSAQLDKVDTRFRQIEKDQILVVVDIRERLAGLEAEAKATNLRLARIENKLDRIFP